MPEESLPTARLTATLSQCFAHFALEASFELTASLTVLFGPSAAGKSTLLRLLAGLDQPRAGRVTLDGRTLLDTQHRIFVAPGRRNIGYVPQRPTLFPHRTVAENIAFGLQHLTPTERNQRIDEMLALVDAETLRHRKPAQLSGGESQRIAIARALAPRPRLLLFDEPLAALDAAAKPPIVACLQRSGIPLLYVSHDLAEIWNLPAQALLIEAGHITARGPLREVLAPYRTHLLTQLQA